MCNGLVEKFNGTLKTMLKRVCAEKPHDWDKYLNAALFAYREVPKESLGFSLFDLIYGRSVRGPMAILKELWSKDIQDPQVKTTYQYVVYLRHRFDYLCDIAHKNLQKASRKQKFQYDKNARQRNMKVGEKVLILLPKKANKLLLQWRGPYTVVERFGKCDYRVQVGKKLKTFHANLLKRYIEWDQVDTQVSGHVSVAVLEPYDNESDDDDDKEILWTSPIAVSQETPTELKISEELNDSERQEVRNLVNEFPDVFTDKPGLTDLLEHEIKTTTDTPIRLKLYPLPFAMTDVVSDEIEKNVRNAGY